MTPEQINAALERGRAIWEEIYTDGRLPFVKIDPDEHRRIGCHELISSKRVRTPA